MGAMSGGSFLLQHLLQGLFLGAWAGGSLLLLLPLIRAVRRGAVRYRRLQSLNAGTALPSVRRERGLWSRLVSRGPLKHLREEMEIAEMRAGVEPVLALMLILAFGGWFGAEAAVKLLQVKFAVGADRQIPIQAWLLSSGAALFLASLPYFWIRFRVQQKRQRIALRMIAVVQNLIGHYRPRLTLAEVIVKSSDSMPYEVRSEWRRLELALHMKGVQEALYDFARRVDNEWGDDLADLLLIGSHYGTDVTEALHHLTLRMQTAKRLEENRLAMITVYRLGTTFMAGFAFFVVGFNIYADGTNYRHYFVDPAGRMLLLASFAVMFVSMVMVVRSGRRAF
ncbi:type II secretion system F family protein [Paenibacillus mucilaginosus]|uniref:Type II secretion system protein GspF domain-containing protein n=1 Tax=Paenibacillus mucilaginosus (strain KNP414) TaxID=1036673 RepID=F8FAE8_PAEMK|nr:hypothetical protein [Paenibacillus mucilaginosus]AEI39601.1 hypothetical protein KNP414_01011 [Paenibacillus mucilaginosus KNP414]MCG7218027.1 hypothetical protein [Paenibacillus mucilaginosus]WDM28545.1 hypothetical protein KCX80_04685 [Paenibacillus mucilaginosus]